ncbi:DUF6176 family protein [Halosimplex marinum]|uniref:DUF6176 family protein n=1 Tax=Halosimplex marinum TaxID=3396620 RepID=UPI003F564C0A
MPEVTLARARIEDGKADRLRSWFEELQERESEVVATLRHEGVYTETAFVRSTDEEAYLYVYMEAEDLAAADEAGDEEAYDIDEEHHEVLRETLVGDWEPLETIGHFTNPDLR